MTEFVESYMDNYPDLFAFFDLSFELDIDMIMMERGTYSLLDCIGDVGGLTEFLYVFFGLQVMRFSKLRMSAEITSSLNFIGSKEYKGMAKDISE